MSVDTARRLIDLSCGQVLDPPHPVVRGALHAAADAAALPYAPRGGEQALRSAVAAHYTGRTGRPVDASAVTVVPGVRQGLFAALAAAARGREVLMPAPHWSHYPRVIDLAGGVAVAVPGEPTDGWRADVAHLDVRRTPRTAAVLLTSPVNPTGAVLGRPRVREIARWAADHDVRLVVDDAYWAYAGCDDVVADAGPRAVLVGGVSKVHALAGLRLGWVCSPPDLSGAVDDVVEHVTGPTSTPSQAAGLAALTEPFCAADVAARARRQAQALAAATALMGTIAAVDVVPAQAGMYLCLSVQRPLRARALGAVDDRALCAAIEHRVGVRLRAGSTFGLPGHVRLSTAAPWTELEEATARLRDLSIATRRDDHLTTSAFSSGEQYR